MPQGSAAISLCHAAKYCCYAVIYGDCSGIPGYIMSRSSQQVLSMADMTPLALSALLAGASRLAAWLLHCGAEFRDGIEEARAMALRYRTLAALTDRELTARGLRRADIPRAVLASVDDI